MNALLKPVESINQNEFAGVPVLSGPDGTFAVKSALQNTMCLLEDGRLLVRRGANLDQDVLAYKEDLRNARIAHRVVEVTVEQLQEVYSNSGELGSQKAKKPNSVRQAQVVAIIRHAMERDASDIHFIVGERIGRLRYRIDGVMVDQDSLPAEEMSDVIAAMYQSMCDVAEETFKKQKAQDARLSETFLNATGLYGARIATMPRVPGQLVVLRLLYSAKNRPTSMEQLGYIPEQLAFFKRMTQMKEGLYIFSGPTGSGKSTSLQVMCESMLANFNDEVHGVTLEDPTEYTIKGWDQCAVPRNERRMADWGTAIRALMRCDIDVAMIGEMRDAESVAAATEVALTGHLVLTTLHANDAPGVLQRISEMGVGRDIYGDPGLIRGLVNQKLSPLLCPHCKIRWDDRAPGRHEDDFVARVEHYCDTSKVYVAGPGCGHCRNGVKGRRVIAEVMPTTQKNMEIFCERGRLAARQFWVREEGGITRTSVLIGAINEGVIDPEHGEKYVNLLDIDQELGDGTA
ncbi:GspE/PulE family protein [Xanthomonas citri]|uniref:GspE/PulE family protein n=1 Tax=Xanthomonas citri TaxID=346 RepID=UPI000CCF9744|nr:ATPase, T2SS/T4P/T4SS family [Xanthomonas citri]PNV26793.1 pilus assembly protein [Xanthomonas citri]